MTIEESAIHGVPLAEVEALGKEAHLWTLEIPQPLDGVKRDALGSVLCAQERDRQRRFRFERDRDLYLAAHALVRVTLSRYAAVAPARWEFNTNQYGRPEICNAGWAGKLRFNLSHTHGLAACIVTEGADCGVDAERIKAFDDMEVIARTVFSETEVTALLALPAPSQVRRFFDYWTLKEAYIKARGMGLALPLAEFTFRLVESEPISIVFSNVIDDDPTQWAFSSRMQGQSHNLAVALRHHCGSNLIVVDRPITIDELSHSIRGPEWNG